MKSMTRFSVIGDERKVIIGLDKENIFQPDTVYEIFEFDGEFVIRPAGKNALPEKGFPSKLSKIGDILNSGMAFVTPEELYGFRDETNTSTEEYPTDAQLAAKQIHSIHCPAYTTEAYKKRGHVPGQCTCKTSTDK